MKTVYDILGVAADADDRTIGMAFRKIAKRYHPDVVGGDHAAEEQFKRITAAHALIKCPQRRAAYDQQLRLIRQQIRRQRKITITGCAISAVISAGLVGIIVPHFGKPIPSRSDASPSLPSESSAHQVAAIIGGTSEGMRTVSAAFTPTAPDTAVDGLASAELATASSVTPFDGQSAVETKAPSSAGPRSLAVPATRATVVGGSALATPLPGNTAAAGTTALAMGGVAEGSFDGLPAEAPRADVSTCMASRPPERQLPPGELADLRRRGKEFLANGIVAAARLIFQRAAEACDTDAAFALGATYDPVMLRTLGTRALAPDIATARAWYEKAKTLGSVEASNQLALLAKAND